MAVDVGRDDDGIVRCTGGGGRSVDGDGTAGEEDEGVAFDWTGVFAGAGRLYDALSKTSRFGLGPSSAARVMLPGAADVVIGSEAAIFLFNDPDEVVVEDSAGPVRGRLSVGRTRFDMATSESRFREPT
jgi:hypothetical protein